MNNTLRFGYWIFISIFAISFLISCSGNSSNSYTIEGSVTPSAAGKVTPANGEYDEGTEVEVRAEANDAWMFSSWEGDISGTENPIVVTVETDMVFTAMFEKLQHPLEVNTEGGGTVEENIIESKMTDYETGTKVELNAVADDGWVFVEWQGDLSGNENPQTLTMDEAKSVTAVFERKSYPLTIETEGEGNVTEEVVEDPAKDYAYETVVEMTANPAEGWEFARWEGDVEGTDNPKQITIDGEKTVTAVFEREGYELTVEIEGKGSVNEEVVENAAKTSYPYDSVVELTADPDDGWTFVRWEGDLDGDNNPEQIEMDGNKTVTAVFERRDYSLTIHTDGEGTVAEEVVSEPEKDYTYETVVELTATPADGWNFIRWEGDLDGDENPKEITVDGEKEVTAVFARESFDLTVNVTGQGSVNEETTGQAKTAYEFNTIVELTAQPDEGWEFDHWEGDLDGNNNPAEITIDGSKTVTAVFTEAQYELDLSTEGDGSISVEPAKDFYDYGDEIEVTAHPGELAAFKEWGGDLSGSENPKTVTVTSDLSIIAIFGGRAEVETAGVSDMRVNSVTGGGNVEDNGGFEITERGVCWTTEDEFPNTADDCTTDGDGMGTFISDITGLTQGLTYYVRAYATNEAGTAYGETVEFLAGYVSHGYVDGVTPSGDSQFENRSYKLVESEWKGGVGKIWIEKNLGSTGPVKNENDSNGGRAGWYFQFNRTQGYYHDGSSRTPGGSWDSDGAGKGDWDINNDPCREAFGGNWRIPTAAEWSDFRSAPKSDDGMAGGDLSDAFNSLLRIHAAGVIIISGDLDERGSSVGFWTSDQANSDDGDYVWITSSDSMMDTGPKAGATPLRCVKD